MPTRRVLFASTVGLLLLAACVAWYASARKSRALVAEIESVLDEARSIVDTASRENIRQLALREFSEVTDGIEEAQGLLDSGRTDEARPAAESALARARKAQKLALSRVTVARAATLMALTNRVLHRPAAGLAWDDARTHMSLYDGDRIATKKRSEAMLAFEQGGEMRIEQDSIVAVERFVENRVKQHLAMTLSVAEGNVRSVVGRKDGRDVFLELNLPHAEVRVDTATLEGGQAEVATHVAPDRTSRVAVYSGEAEVVTPSGDKLLVSENQFAEVSAEGGLSEALRLPGSAEAMLPAPGDKVYVSPFRPDVAFKWQRGSECKYHRVEVASHPVFMDKLVDETTPRSRFTAANLDKGSYVWRLSCVDDRGVQGPYSRSNPFQVIVDGKAPKIEVLGPSSTHVLTSQTVEARCRAEAASTVFINGEEAAPDGRAEYARTVRLEPGLNTLVFEAIDAAGNVTHQSHLVTLEPTTHEPTSD